MTALFVLDLHGVVTRGAALLPGAREAVTGLERQGHRLAYLSNSASTRPDQIALMLDRLGISCTADQVMTAGWATGLWIRRQPVTGPLRVLVLGSAGIEETLREMLPPGAVDSAGAGHQFVVAARDPGLTWVRLEAAWRAVRAGARLVAPSTDLEVPGGEGPELGPGALVRSLEEAAGVRATVVGKPSTFAVAALLEQMHHTGPVWMVGDTPQTDIAAGLAYGCGTVLVRTGNGRTYRPGRDPTPHLVVDDLLELSRYCAGPAWRDAI